MSESRVAAQVGRVLGGRYRLVALIGVGASGEVYLADDTKLRRQVAIKVLHRALASDEIFLERFRAEAQTVASLNHPNVVAIHDWGDEDPPFIVSEYLSGGSLRAMLDEVGTLTPSQALLIALEATKGLDYAHKRNVVQRDIKPANLLFDSEGHVRIADFGLAKALAEASATEPTGGVLGTVRYASPEQAHGHRVDAKSDIYSLALVLYEAVTGELPFDADTPIATLMARVDVPLQPDPEVFGALAEPLAAAAVIDPALRPDAGSFHNMLMGAASGLPRPEPLPLVGAMGFDPLQVADDGDRTLIGAGGPPLEGERDGAEVDRSRRRERRRRRRWPWMTLMTFILAAVGLAIYFGVQTSEVATRILPDATGMTEEELQQEVGDFWQLQPALARQDGSVPGTIIRTEPAAGVELEEGVLVTYFVSQGNELKPVPSNLVGLTVEEAELFLVGAGLELGEVIERNDEEAAAGIVLEVGESATQLPGGEAVDLVVSSGPALRVVPEDLPGLTFDEASSQLAVERLGAERVDEYDNAVAEGVVISVDPPAGTELERESVVTLTVSLGRQPVVVPNVAGGDVLTASATLEAAGLCIGETDGPANTPVIATDPPAGTTVFFGDCVRIVTSQALAGS